MTVKLQSSTWELSCIGFFGKGAFDGYGKKQRKNSRKRVL